MNTENTLNPAQEQALAEFDQIAANPPSKNVLFRFLQKRADGFFSEMNHTNKSPLTRRQRRHLARNLAKRLSNQTMSAHREAAHANV